MTEPGAAVSPEGTLNTATTRPQALEGQANFSPSRAGTWPPEPDRARPPRVAAPLLLTACLALLADALTRSTGGTLGMNLPVWVSVFMIATLTVLQKARRSANRAANQEASRGASQQGMVLLGSALGLACLFVVRDAPPTLEFLNFMAFLLALTLGVATLRFPDFHLASVIHMIGTAFMGMVNNLIGPFVVLERFPWQKLSLPASASKGWVTGALLTLPVLAVFGGLLASADTSFAHLFTGLLNWEPGDLFTRALTLLLWSVFTGGLVYSALLASGPVGHGSRGGKFARLGLTELGLPLGSLAGLFIVFLLVQLPYLLSGTLPDGLTFAEYIRKGFGELMTVAFLTLALLLGAHGLARPDIRQGAAYRALNLAVLAPLTLVILSAANRWHLYHQAYGLSETRLLGAAFLTWIVACLGWLAYLLWRGDLRRFAYPALLMGLGTLWITTMLNPAAQITRNNIHRQTAAITNDLRSTPQQANALELLDLGADAVPLIVQNLDTLVPTCGPSANCLTRQDIINQLHDDYDTPRDPRAWNASYARAWRIVQQLPLPPPHGR